MKQSPPSRTGKLRRSDSLRRTGRTRDTGQLKQATPSSTDPQGFFPPSPRSLQETGLSLGFLSDLALKVLYSEGYLSGVEWCVLTNGNEFG